MKKSTKTKSFIMLTVAAVMLVMLTLCFLVCRYTMKAETHVRYVGIMDVASEKIAKSISGMEMNAMNVFDEVQKHMESPDAVIEALHSKTSLNPDVNGYFAAFELLDALHRLRHGTRKEVDALHVLGDHGVADVAEARLGHTGNHVL